MDLMSLVPILMPPIVSPDWCGTFRAEAMTVSAFIAEGNSTSDLSDWAVEGLVWFPLFFVRGVLALTGGDPVRSMTRISSDDVPAGIWSSLGLGRLGRLTGESSTAEVWLSELSLFLLGHLSVSQ